MSTVWEQSESAQPFPVSLAVYAATVFIIMKNTEVSF